MAKVTNMAALGRTMCTGWATFSLRQLPRRLECNHRHFITCTKGVKNLLCHPRVQLSNNACRSLSKTNCQRVNPHAFNYTRPSCQSRNVPPLTLVVLSQNARFYSQETTKPGSITDELLKTKIASEKQTSESSGGSSEKQDQPKDDKKKSRFAGFTGKNAWKLGMVFLGSMGIFTCGSLLFLWGAPSLDEDGKEIKDDFTSLPKWQAYPKRAFREFRFFKKMIEEPSSDKLLPDPLKEPYYQPPYTLVLEMTGVLVHPDWTLNTGWRFKKRPAVTYFLQQVGPPLYEVVVYTHEQGFTAFPIIDGLDPQGMVSFRLFRDATRYIDGTHVKDLDCLNRDLKKVIIVDCDGNAVKLHPSNALRLKKWTGSDDDRLLVDLAVFLRTLAMSGVDDVRPILDYYAQFDDPLEAFKENQRKLQEEQEKTMQQKREQEDAKKPLKNWGFSLSGRRR